MTNLDEYNLTRQIYNAKSDKDAYKLLFDSKLLENDFSDRIQFWYQKNKCKKEQISAPNIQ